MYPFYINTVSFQFLTDKLLTLLVFTPNKSDLENMSLDPCYIYVPYFKFWLKKINVYICSCFMFCLFCFLLEFVSPIVFSWSYYNYIPHPWPATQSHPPPPKKKRRKKWFNTSAHPFLYLKNLKTLEINITGHKFVSSQLKRTDWNKYFFTKNIISSTSNQPSF